MDVREIIKDEHREVAELFDQVEECEPGDEALRELAREIETKLSQHLAIEERLFYAKLKQGAEAGDERVDIFEAYTEHDVAKQLLVIIKKTRKYDERFKAELLVLGESVKHHVQEEESKVFELAADILEPEEFESIGAAWEKAKDRGDGMVRRTASAASR